MKLKNAERVDNAVLKYSAPVLKRNFGKISLARCAYGCNNPDGYGCSSGGHD